MRGDERKQERRITPRVRVRFNRRLMVLAGVFFAAALAVIIQVYKIQILNHEVLASKAAEQQYMTDAFSTRRGMILDRNGFPLALSTYVFRIGMTPSDVRAWNDNISDEVIAGKIAEILALTDEQKESVLDAVRTDRSRGWKGLKNNILGRQERPYVQIARNIPEEQAAKLKTWLSENGVGGIRFDAEEKRVYNNGLLGSSVIGLTRLEEGRLYGVSGLEAAYDDILSGKPGYTYARHNNYGNRGIVPFSPAVTSPVQQSRNLVSSLDLGIEKILREELLSAAAAAGLKKGVQGIVLDVASGDILAMEQISSFFLEAPAAKPIGFTDEEWAVLSSKEKNDYLSTYLWNNVNISDVYEPGSIFKSVTLAVGLETGASGEDTLFSDGPVTIQGALIKCASEHHHGTETLREGFYNSCNPVFVRLGRMIGKDTYYSWIRRLGLYGKSGVDLPGETSGILHANPMPIDFANLTFGESSSFTGIQMARFYAAIGNGGNPVTPRAAIGVSADDLESLVPFEVSQNESVLSGQTCRLIWPMMQDVVTKGTAVNLFGAMGFGIGGKTGTSAVTTIVRKPAEETGEGQEEPQEAEQKIAYTFSFACLFPIEQPRYAAILTVREPVSDVTSKLAARFAARTASRILSRDGVRPVYSEREADILSRKVMLENLEGMTLREAAVRLQNMNLTPVVPEGTFYLDQACVRMLPAAGSAVGYGSTVWLYPETENEVEWVTVPDFRGRTYHECVYLAAEYGIAVCPDGKPNGLATGQSVPPTADVPKPGKEDDASGTPAGSTDAEAAKASGKVKRGEVIQLHFEDQ